MEYTVPDYYEEFSCIAGACEDTCCAGWAIVIDDETMQKYRTMKGGFGNRLRNSMDEKEGTFRQYDRRCAFLNEENLCDIYTEAGAEYLCRTCRQYPRHIEEYENLREISLSLSCPEAARIILGKKDAVRLRTVEKRGGEEYEEFDYFLFSALMDTREVVMEILQDRELSIDMRLSMAVALCHDVQRRVSAGELFSVSEVLDRYCADGAKERFASVRKSKDDREITRYNACHAMFRKLYELEELRTPIPENKRVGWKEFLKTCEKALYGDGGEESLAAYEKRCQHKLDEVILEQIAVYFTYTYFVGAVYDGKPYSKMKLAVVSTILIRELLTAGICAADSENEMEEPVFSEYVHIAHSYAREIEHSDENLKKLEEMFSHDEAFRLSNILAGLRDIDCI